jgi:hypothetical protein
MSIVRYLPYVSVVFGILGVALGLIFSSWFFLLALIAFMFFPILYASGLIDQLDRRHLEIYRQSAFFSYVVIGIFLAVVIISTKVSPGSVSSRSIIMYLTVLLVSSFLLAAVVQRFHSLLFGRLLCLVVGIFWLLFIILSGVGSEHWLIFLVMESLAVVLPVLLALVFSWRIPFLSGIFLIAAGTFHLFFFNAHESLIVITLLPLPEWIAGYLFIYESRSMKRVEDAHRSLGRDPGSEDPEQ